MREEKTRALINLVGERLDLVSAFIIEHWLMFVLLPLLVIISMGICKKVSKFKLNVWGPYVTLVVAVLYLVVRFGLLGDIDLSIFSLFDSKDIGFISVVRFIVKISVIGFVTYLLSIRSMHSSIFKNELNVIEGQRDLPGPDVPHWSSLISIIGFGLTIIFLSGIWCWIFSVVFWVLGGFVVVPLREKWVPTIFKKPLKKDKSPKKNQQNKENPFFNKLSGLLKKVKFLKKLLDERDSQKKNSSFWTLVFPTHYRDVDEKGEIIYNEENITLLTGLHWCWIPLWMPFLQIRLLRYETVERTFSTQALPTKRIEVVDEAGDKKATFAAKTLPGATLQTDFRLTILTNTRSQVWFNISDEDRAASIRVAGDATTGWLSSRYRELTIEDILNKFKPPIDNLRLRKCKKEEENTEIGKFNWAELDELLRNRIGHCLQGLQFLDHNLDARLEVAANELAAAQASVALLKVKGRALGEGRIAEVEIFARKFYNIPEDESVPQAKMESAFQLILSKITRDNSRVVVLPEDKRPIIVSAIN